MVLRTPSFVCECTSGSCIAGLSAFLSRKLQSAISLASSQLRGSVTVRTGQRSSGPRKGIVKSFKFVADAGYTVARAQMFRFRSGQEFDAEVDVIEDRKVFMKATKNARQQDFKEVSVSNFWELLKHRWAYISEANILTMSSSELPTYEQFTFDFLFILPQLDEWRKAFGERQLLLEVSGGRLRSLFEQLADSEERGAGGPAHRSENFGQVFSGSFRGDKVAVKKLLPETHENGDHVDSFVAEIKITVTLNHPHLVRFVGVTWTSASDLCVVQEFMKGGDLRLQLDRYEAGRHAVDFNRQKTQIVMHICSVLAGMHSLSPPVIHSNLKSRDVPLNGTMEAKVTNFGTSHKRTVVLLDMVSTPYTQARQQICDPSWCSLQEAAILQKVTKGSLRVFSESGPMALAELGRTCVFVIPVKHPTASEALYRLQTILAQELA
ncbi:TKL protein kinase [Phytophthora cinnamomi]|uniref:TKL protein kinase n=1 Tax=Phytophthora cinnamomi TaxID=4785 RepID=UPI003559B5CB|nr:TKL protein kinase [Phytophthora cinnamomi]